MDELQTPTVELCGKHLHTAGLLAGQYGPMHTTKPQTHIHIQYLALGAQVDPLQEK